MSSPSSPPSPSSSGVPTNCGGGCGALTTARSPDTPTGGTSCHTLPSGRSGSRHEQAHRSRRCAPQDDDVPEIGDELAAARAMENLGEQLKRTAYGDMKAVGAPARQDSLKPYTGRLDMEGS
ncbi:dsRBD fold-containing protein [Streptomyces sp. NPDC056938]|uniref:dsRBD fold-containing protein n=1 Tax=unclassified Streptomyces TaxID=2593676 RepID=UPI003628BFE8